MHALPSRAGTVSAGRTAARNASSRMSSSAVVAAAIAAGSFEWTPATPIGQTSSAIRAAGMPAAASRFSKRARLVALPIRPT